VSRREEDEFAEPPPHDMTAEQAVLGGMMLSKDALGEVREIIGAAETFYRPAHQLVFETILALDDAGCPAEVIAVADRLRDTRRLGQAGGAPYLHTLIAAVPTAANAAYYAGLVREKAAERRVIETGQRMVQIGWAPGLDLEEKLAEAWRQMEAAADLISAPRSASLAELLPGVLDRIEAGPPPGAVRSGWRDLDELTGGLLGGQLVTVGARPTVGKSVVLSNWAVKAALAGVPVLYYSLEMSTAECLNRMLAAEAGVDLLRMRAGAAVLTDAEWTRLGEATSRLSACPLRVNDAGTLRVGDIRADLRRARRAKAPVGLVVIDYAQLMTVATRRDNNRQAEVSEITGALKAAAKEHDCSVLVGAQLNRGPEMRRDRRPVLADLRDSGSFEQDSDIVILLARDDAYDPQSARAGEIDFIVAKHRAGPVATITSAFAGHQARVDDMAWSPSDAAAPAGGTADRQQAAEARADELAAARARHAQDAPF
jgi:replicative DNA helicase